MSIVKPQNTIVLNNMLILEDGYIILPKGCRARAVLNDAEYVSLIQSHGPKEQERMVNIAGREILRVPLAETIFVKAEKEINAMREEDLAIEAADIYLESLANLKVHYTPLLEYLLNSLERYTIIDLQGIKNDEQKFMTRVAASMVAIAATYTELFDVEDCFVEELCDSECDETTV